jgi:glycogen(starch) synthase
VVGTGPELSAIKARHEPRGIEFSGALTQAQVYMLTSQAALYIVPSVWEEPCATTVMEALALGRTVFALRQGGTPELAKYATSPGRLSLFGSMEELVQAIPLHTSAAPVEYSLDRQSDIKMRLPEILDVYRTNAAGQVLSEH